MSRKFDRSAHIRHSAGAIVRHMLPRLFRPRPRFLALRLVGRCLLALIAPRLAWRSLRSLMLQEPADE